jgi:hypothetical protein
MVRRGTHDVPADVPPGPASAAAAATAAADPTTILLEPNRPPDSESLSIVEVEPRGGPVLLVRELRFLRLYRRAAEEPERGPVETIMRAQRERPELELASPLSETDVEALQPEVGAPLPRELRAILRSHGRVPPALGRTASNWDLSPRSKRKGFVSVAICGVVMIVIALKRPDLVR